MLPLIFLLALLTRFIALDQSLWLDEGITAKVVRQFNLIEIIQRFSPADFHPPLYYLFMKLWTNIFGYSEIALRFPSIIFSLLAGWFVYLIGKRLVNKKVGLWPAAFFLFNPLIVYYSQEARMYMMVTFLLTAAVYFIIRSIPNFFASVGSSSHSRSPKSQKNWYLRSNNLFLANLFLVLSLMTFYGSIFLIIPILLIFLFKKQYEYFLVSFLILTSAFLILLPLLYQQYLNSRQTLIAVANWKAVLGPASLKNLLLIPLKFVVGRVSFEPKVLYYLLSGLWTAIIFYFAGKGAKKEKKGLILALMLIFPIVLGFLFSVFTPLFQYFRFLYLIPLLAILLAFGTQKTSIYRYIVISGFVLFSFIYLLNPNFHREDWKSLAKTLPNKAIVCMIPSSADPLVYYRKDISIIPLPHCTPGPRTIVIPYTADIHGVDYKKTLRDKGFKQEKTLNFRQLQYEVWQR